MDEQTHAANLAVEFDADAQPLEAEFREAIADAIQFLLLMRDLYGLRHIDVASPEGELLAVVCMAEATPEGAHETRQQRRARERRSRRH